MPKIIKDIENNKINSLENSKNKIIGNKKIIAKLIAIKVFWYRTSDNSEIIE